MSKLGRNPLEKKRTSPVSQMIERNIAPASVPGDDRQPEVIRESRDLYTRLRQMNIELDWSHVLRRLYGKVRR